MESIEKLLAFFRREFQAEERSGFARLARVPDSYVMGKLAYFRSLNRTEQLAFADCCAHWAVARYGFVLGIERFDHTQHPFFPQWRIAHTCGDFGASKSVPHLRATVQQFKIDRHSGVQSYVTKEQFDYALSIQSIKAPELRKRVRAALKPLGYYRTDELGYCCCRQADRRFRVHVGYGGGGAQLRYVVARSEFVGVHPLIQFGFELALGFGLGDWDFIVEENVDDVFSLFTEVVNYSYELPDRIRAEVAS